GSSSPTGPLRNRRYGRFSLQFAPPDEPAANGKQQAFGENIQHQLPVVGSLEKQQQEIPCRRALERIRKQSRQQLQYEKGQVVEQYDSPVPRDQRHQHCEFGERRK